MPSPKIVTVNGSLFVDQADGLGTRVAMSDNEPTRGSYSFYIPNFTPAANPTDILVIQGAANKTIRLRQFNVGGTAASAANIQILLARWSTANAGGTFTPQPLLKRDTNDDGPYSTVNLYTANPTGLGTLIGYPDGGRLNLAPAANGGIDRLSLQFGWINDKCPVIRGVNDFLCINLGGTAWPAGGLLDMSLVVTED